MVKSPSSGLLLAKEAGRRGWGGMSPDFLVPPTLSAWARWVFPAAPSWEVGIAPPGAGPCRSGWWVGGWSGGCGDAGQCCWAPRLAPSSPTAAHPTVLQEARPVGKSRLQEHNSSWLPRSPASHPKQPLSQQGTLRFLSPSEDKGLTEAQSWWGRAGRSHCQG